MALRAHPDETACVGYWPLTGNPCKDLPRDGYTTCTAHAPEGDLRPPPPPDEKRCRGTNRWSGERCRMHAMLGTTACRAHGAGARQVRKKAEATVSEQRARRLVETYGRKIDTTAVEALLDEVQWTAGHVAWLRERVQALEESELTWGLTRVKEGGDDRGTTEEAGTHALVRLYQAERTHLVKVCSEAIRAGIEERRVKLAEQQGELVADVIRQILGDLNLSPEQQARVADVVPLRLRALSAAG